MAALSLDIGRARAAPMRDMSVPCSRCAVASGCRSDLDAVVA
jgi:hypothetical protein